MTDFTFFTNEPGQTLLDRFRKTLKDVKQFDVLVGYFRSSGFFNLFQSLEPIDKVRVLVGLNLDRRAYDIIDSAKTPTTLEFESHKQVKDTFTNNLITELDHSLDSY